MVYEKLHDRLVKMSADLIALLAGQENVVAAWQLPTARVRAARRAVRSRRWRRITTRTYLAGPAKPTEQQRLWAAVLHCGEHARLSGRAALNLHGWTLESEPPYDVVVPAGVQPARRPSWIRLHRVSMTPTGPAATPPRTSVHVATAHAAAWARSEREAMLVVISALQQRLTTPAHLLSALAGLPKLRRRRLIADMVKEFRDGAHSLNELDFGTLCRRFSLPEPRRQQRMFDEGGRLRAIDVEFDTASGGVLRVEIEGLHHGGIEQYLIDADRQNRLQVENPGTTLRAFAWLLNHDPDPFMTDLGRWLQQT